MEKRNEKRKVPIVLSMAALISLLFLWVISAAAVPNNVVKDPAEVPPPLERSNPTTVPVNITVKEIIAELAPGVNFSFWTYGGTVPGPMVRVMEGDTVVVNLSNDPANKHSHNIDFHAVMGPGGGATVTNIAPGKSTIFTFKAMRAGAYVYHCAGEGKPWEHVSHGMYGLIMVEPKGGLKKVDKEFYFAQGEWYLSATPKITGDGISYFDLDLDKAMAEHPDFYTFNGHTQALKTIKPNVVVDQDDKVRVFFATGGPDIGSNFHIIGQVFDKSYTGHPDSFTKNEETVYVAPGDAGVFELETLVPGRYLAVDHSLWRASRGASGFLDVIPEKPPTPEDPNGSWPLDIYFPLAYGPRLIR